MNKHAENIYTVDFQNASVEIDTLPQGEKTGVKEIWEPGKKILSWSNRSIYSNGEVCETRFEGFLWTSRELFDKDEFFEIDLCKFLSLAFKTSNPYIVFTGVQQDYAQRGKPTYVRPRYVVLKKSEVWLGDVKKSEVKFDVSDKMLPAISGKIKTIVKNVNAYMGTSFIVSVSGLDENECNLLGFYYQDESSFIVPQKNRSSQGVEIDTMNLSEVKKMGLTPIQYYGFGNKIILTEFDIFDMDLAKNVLPRELHILKNGTKVSFALTCLNDTWIELSEKNLKFSLSNRGSIVVKTKNQRFYSTYLDGAPDSGYCEIHIDQSFFHKKDQVSGDCWLASGKEMFVTSAKAKSKKIDRSFFRPLFIGNTKKKEAGTYVPLDIFEKAEKIDPIQNPRNKKETFPWYTSRLHSTLTFEELQEEDKFQKKISVGKWHDRSLVDYKKYGFVERFFAETHTASSKTGKTMIKEIVLEDLMGNQDALFDYISQIESEYSLFSGIVTQPDFALKYAAQKLLS